MGEGLSIVQRGDMRSFIVKVLLILAVALACGALVNAVRPRGAVSWVEDWSRYVEARAITDGIFIITLVEALDIVKARNHVVLDARRAWITTRGISPVRCLCRLCPSVSTCRAASTSPAVVLRSIRMPNGRPPGNWSRMPGSWRWRWLHGWAIGAGALCAGKGTIQEKDG